jgi:hypothetical protein
MAKGSVTFTSEELRKVLAEAADAALRQAGYTKQGTPKPKDKPDMDALVKKQFAKAGFKDVTPRVDVLTYDKWLEKGFRVKKGEKSVRCKQFRLFHSSQVQKDEPAVAEPKAPVTAQPANPNAKKRKLGLPFAKHAPAEPSSKEG